MPVEAKIEWDRLCDRCEDCGLPGPMLVPGNFNTGPLQVTIRNESDAFGYTNSGTTLKEVIDDAIIYVWGYRNCLRDSKAACTPQLVGGHMTTTEGEPR